MNSKKMLTYMKRYNISNSIENFYYQYYQAEYISFISFKKYIFGSYSAFLVNKPRIEEYKIKNKITRTIQGSQYSSRRCVKSRPSEFGWIGAGLTYESFENFFSDSFLLEYYIQMRMIESGIDSHLTNSQKKDVIQRVVHKNNISGVYAATVLLSELMIFYGKSNYNLLTSKNRSAIISNELSPSPSGRNLENTSKKLDEWLKNIEAEGKKYKQKNNLFQEGSTTNTSLIYKGY